ncbi:cytidylate kinase family protein [Patescibacteria group bacterium]|nr:cytidylate kinase family protein [Patescibacteria group bacterium]
MYTKITLSGRICTGKSTVFRLLAEKLGWPTFSASQAFRDYAKTHQKSLQLAEEQNDQLTKSIDEKTRVVLLSNDHIIAEGWMAGIMAEGMPDVLRVLLICDDSVREKRFADRSSLSIEEAKRQISEREENWVAKLTNMYGRSDFFDPKNYTFVVDTTHRTPEESVEEIMRHL